MILLWNKCYKSRLDWASG